ncbi:hypothetical protein CDAR_468871 [Caerostris darwini]|uniref:Uncharacterized protein n=1 Tax=Caerostris darwini TaxID=1538125 RepID=A0AAV4R6Y1_9ARAC|nr:hypothetical protein CDAR_468871 [Caerostris darwini]
MLVDGTNSAADMSSDSTVTTVGPQPSQDDPIEITDEIKQLKRQKNYEIAYLILRELLAGRKPGTVIYSSLFLLGEAS